MPAESERLRRRISGRDRWFLALLALLALVGTPGAVLLLSHRSHARTDDRCVTTMRASIMGGATYKYCGANAVTACRQFAAEDKALAARCAELGYLKTP
ncbi:MAG: hypothetical protein ACYDA3_10635 [Gaiellaceae bacterium]